MKKQQRKEAENESESDSDGEKYIVAKNTVNICMKYLNNQYNSIII